jgi:hypothetical protein
MLGRVDHGFVDINAMALNAAIKGLMSVAWAGPRRYLDRHA